MGLTEGTKWYPMGKVGGTPFSDLLRDDECERLREELAEFPSYLLCLQKEGRERGTVLQIATSRGASEAVSVIVRMLIDLHSAAKEFPAQEPASGSWCDYIEEVNGHSSPRLVNEDPLGVGELDAILKELSSPTRSCVALSLKPLLPFISNRTSAITIALFIDDPSLVQQQGSELTQLQLLLYALECEADHCFDRLLHGYRDDQDLIHEAAAMNWPNAVRRLVAMGEDPNGRDVIAQTPLHRAAATNAGEAAKTLLGLGANPLFENIRGETAMHIAIEHRSVDCASLLADSIAVAWDSESLKVVVQRAVQADMFEIAAQLLRLPQGPSIYQPALSTSVTRWLFALVVLVLANATDNASEEIMPLLTVGDFAEAAHILGLLRQSVDEAIDSFLSAVKAEAVTNYAAIRSNGSTFGVPISLLLCGASLAVATTKSNKTFHELHPLLKPVFGSKYDNDDLGEAWGNLRAWLKDKGYTLAWPEDSWLKNVSPPLYHAIWRPDDREALFDVLGSLGVSLSRSISAPEMGILLDRKITRFSVHIQTMLRSDKDRLATLQSACASLSATRIQRSVQRRASFTRIPWGFLGWHHNFRTGAIGLIVTLPCAEGMPEALLIGGVEILSNGETYQPLAIRSELFGPDHLLETSEGYKFKVHGLSESLVFRVNGDKSLCHALTIGEPHLIVCPEGIAGETEAFLARVQDKEIRKRSVSDLAGLIAFGPLAAERVVDGLIEIRPPEDACAELRGGLRLRGGIYHKLALPTVQISGAADEASCFWVIDGRHALASISTDEDNVRSIKAPPGGQEYRLLISGKEITRFMVGDSLFERAGPERTLRWPLLLPEKRDYLVLGASGESVIKTRSSRRSVLPTVQFAPCWALSTNAIPLSPVIPAPDETPYPSAHVPAVRAVKKAASGDTLTKSRASQAWLDYYSKATGT